MPAATTPAQNPATTALSAHGVSIWLDDLSRERITSGDLARLIATRNVVGVTTNPTIFAHALRDGQAYAAQVEKLKGQPVDEVVRQLCATDVQSACDLFAPIFTSTSGQDGRVSIEVEPGLAMDADGTVAQATLLHQLVDRPGVLIKIPATEPGLAAIRRTIAMGISVNVTLIFSLARYRQVIEAYLAGLEDALAAGIDLATIRSVASIFVSRIDTEVDRRLEDIGTDDALAARGQFAVANSRLAYQAFGTAFDSPRFARLAAHGANLQRPLWASTGVKNPAYADTRYVTELVAADTVNTMPPATLDAVADHGEITGDTVTGNFSEAVAVVSQIEELGIDVADVFDTLERQGVAKFQESWSELLATVTAALAAS